MGKEEGRAWTIDGADFYYSHIAGLIWAAATSFVLG